MNLQTYLRNHLQESTAKSYYYHINKFKLLNRNTEHYNYQKVMEYIEDLRKNFHSKYLKNDPFCIKKILRLFN
ncbi:hypothetical protein SAMN04488062_1022 [Flavobacterium omnivorum]|uniref:Phage integrase, N-terminal SAM-like domain n=1 Tax=Flavobacterium omnivorum TaxID=178355 RepID=A0A1G7WRU0_9FLAO|nr:hypothetical protein SAMN04488062_1022 [Flavobacterium omnivorum]